MKFSHTADCHLGGHRDSRLRELSNEAFRQFVDISLQNKVEFVLISGDLFNTAIPGIDTLRTAVSELKKLKERKIPVYAIPGSHDYSPSGRTMLSVLEEAGLLVNVWKNSDDDSLQVVEDKSGVSITGILGRAGSLDKEHYDNLDHSISHKEGKKIFLFHTAIRELFSNPHVQSQPVSSLPSGFDYYAGGHIHVRETYSDDKYKLVAYPGPLFPNSFTELEGLQHGGFIIYEGGNIRRENIKLKPVVKLHIDVTGKNASDVSSQTRSQIAIIDVENSIVLLRIEGVLDAGAINDLDLRGLTKTLEDKGAYCVLRNTSKLTTKEFLGQSLDKEEPRDVEKHLVEKHKDELKLEKEDGVLLAMRMLRVLSREPKEGEKQYEYRDSVIEEALEVLQNETV